jgi:toxin ParE1/3/4
MPRLIRSQQAREDLIDIWQHVARDSPEAADRLLDLFDEKCDLLVRSPLIGTACPELSPGLRFFSASNYVIFYCADEHNTTIVRIIHGARDIASLFGDESA